MVRLKGAGQLKKIFEYCGDKLKYLCLKFTIRVNIQSNFM